MSFVACALGGYAVLMALLLRSDRRAPRYRRGARLTGLGATKLNEINAGRHWATLADPEGNEFDLIAG